MSAALLPTAREQVIKARDLVTSARSITHGFTKGKARDLIYARLEEAGAVLNAALAAPMVEQGETPETDALKIEGWWVDADGKKVCSRSDFEAMADKCASLERRLRAQATATEGA